MRLGGWMAAALALWTMTVAGQAGRSPDVASRLLHEHPAVAFEPLMMTGAIARANATLAAGATYDPRRGYLADVLDALEIPASSQLLIFSKTGVQGALTSPQNPRAFYFNDSTIVGHVPGATFLEVASLDAQGGARFYTLQQSRVTPPAFTPQRDCLRCHISTSTMDVPGFIARSMYVSGDGRAQPQLGSFVVDHRRDYAERWGGWFVTGAPDTLRHLGNTIVVTPGQAPTASASDVPTLEGRAPIERYLTPFSDVTALAVFDHQMHAMNLLTRLGWQTRAAALTSAPDFSAGSLADLLRETADYLLLVGEAALDGPLAGRGSGFAEDFSARGPKDRRGRSLRDFDRQTRLFRYPGSYMIHSAAFDALPSAARTALYARMRVILEGNDPAPRYQRLAAPARQAVLEILADTKADWLATPSQ